MPAIGKTLKEQRWQGTLKPRSLVGILFAVRPSVEQSLFLIKDSLKSKQLVLLLLPNNHMDCCAIREGVVLSKNSIRMDSQRDLLTFQKHVAVMGHAWK